MRTHLLVTAALLGATHAVKQTLVTQRDGNMGQTLTAEGYLLDNLDEVQEDIESWYDSKLKPFLGRHRKMVYEASLAEAEEKFGQLLETCDEGTRCREEVTSDLKKSLKKTWRQVKVAMDKQVAESVTATRAVVQENWSKLVECGEKANCCEYQEVTIKNLWVQVEHYREAIVEETTKWYDFEDRRKEMVEECPNVDLQCSNPCADGSARAEDCACPSFEEIAYPPCPTSLCADGSERDADTCGCPNVVSEVVLAEPEPVVPSVEDLVGISDSEEIIFEEEPEQISIEPQQVEPETREAPIEQVPVEEAPIEQVPVEEAPIEKEPVKEADPVIEIDDLNPPTNVQTAICGNELEISWDIPDHVGHLILGYDILIDGHYVTECKEHLEVQILDARCTIDWPSLTDDPFFMKQGSVVEAKVRAKYINEGESDFTATAGSAVIPIESSFEDASAYLLEAPLGFTQVPDVPSYSNPLVGIQEWAQARFDFQFGCEMSNAVKKTEDMAPEGEIEKLKEMHEIPADGINSIAVYTKEEEGSPVVSLTFRDSEYQEIVSFRNAEEAKQDYDLYLRYLYLNEGERIIGVRGNESTEMPETGYRGYWKNLQFLVSDGTVDRVLQVE